MFTAPPARLLACALVVAALVAPVSALDRTWIGGNVDWVDGGAATNWNPADEPDSDDRALFNTANTVNLGSNNSINGLDLSGGIDLNTNDFDLTVDGLVTVGGGGTNLFIGGATGSVDADDVVINSGGTFEMARGTLVMDEEAGTALIDLNAGGVFQGNGLINFIDSPGAATVMLVNDGTITALSRAANFLLPPPTGTLHFSDAGLNGRLDLDGSSETGVVNVNRNQSFFTEMQLFDTFNGDLNLSHNATFQFNPTFTLGVGGTITVNNGFVAGGLGFSDIPADTSFIETVNLVQTGGTINVADTDGTLQIDAPFTMSGGSFTNFGTVIFNGVTNITTAAGYDPSSIDSQTIVNANVTINDAAGNFNWDGNGAADTTVSGSALLTITANQIDTADNTFGGTLTLLDGADATINVAATSWTAAGTISKLFAGTSTISGDRVNVTGIVTVNEGVLDMPATTLAAGSDITVNGTLTLGGASELSGPATLTGAGLLRMEGTSTVLASTTVNVATFDWDGLGTGTSHVINSGVAFTINSAVLDGDGDMDDPFTLAGNGSQLIVNNTNGVTQWTANGIITANASTAGTATIGGTSRMILANVINVDGDTDINAPITFGSSSSASIDAGVTLDVGVVNATYAGGSISGAGTYSPGSTNTVTADSSITVATFDFDAGNWTIESGATLTIDVTDYEFGANPFDGTIVLNSGDIFVNSANAEFIMDGTLNMNAPTNGLVTSWSGEPLDIGNDSGALDANINVGGPFISRISAQVDFNSDADVNVAAGGELQLNALVNFDTVNGVNNAEFTGGGALLFNGQVNVNEAVTLNMVGGTVDLDGVDNFGENINIDAPLTINAGTLTNFGRVNGGGGINTITVNNSVGTGTLTVNLDDPEARWTLNGPGVMNLVNDNVTATLLAGSEVNINGTLNVTGDVRTNAALHIAGIVNINTPGQRLILNGDDVVSTIAGGTVSGPGILSATAGRTLSGFGTINTDIDFDGSSFLRAEGGTLTITGDILDVVSISATGLGAVLNVVNPWDSGVAGSVGVSDGVIQGGAITNNAASGIVGRGTVTARVVNNTRLTATSGTLLFQTAGNDNDWDGAGAGLLRANGANSVLELRDTGAPFGFTGTVDAATGGRVFTNGFALDFNPGSTINLNNGAYESTAATDIGGTVTIAGNSTIKVANNTFLTFESGSATSLNGNLELQNNNIIIQSGATFGGAAALIIDEPSHVVLQNGAAVNVVFSNEGTLRPGNSDGIATATLKDYVQTATGELFVELTGTLPNQYDRLLVSQTAQLDGFLSIDLDGGFDPALGTTFDILSSVFGVSGTFDTIDYAGLPAGKTFAISYLPNAVRLTTVVKPSFAADFDDDGDVDQTDYGIWKNAYALNQLGDANGDNVSDAADYTLWRDQLGSGPSLPSVAVPEPSSAALIALAGLAALGRRTLAP